MSLKLSFFCEFIETYVCNYDVCTDFVYGGK
jgi:hypothetical protein